MVSIVLGGPIALGEEGTPMDAPEHTYAGRDVPVRVLVVDDHPAFRRALRAALSMVADVEVAGEAGSGTEACEEAEHLRPDVIVMDLSMPDLSGIDAMRRIHETQPDLPVVILTAHADEGVERAAREAGASGFLAKGSGLRDLMVVLQEATA
jgi:DNA-binding NarL/FixJ family response regulator